MKSVSQGISTLQEGGRISIYIFHKNSFFSINRVGAPGYDTKPKDQYNLNKGFIGVGWHKGSYYIGNLQNPNEDPEHYWNAVNEAINQTRSFHPNIKEFTKKEQKNIFMKSRSYYVLRIEDKFYDECKGIIVFESIHEEAWHNTQAGIPAGGLKTIVDNCFSNEDKAQLAMIIFMKWQIGGASDKMNNSLIQESVWNRQSPESDE